MVACILLRIENHAFTVSEGNTPGVYSHNLYCEMFWYGFK